MWRMVAGGNRPWEPPHPVRVELRSHAVVAEADDPMPSASELGKGRFPPRLLEVIDRCLRLRETARIQGARELLEVLRTASDQSLSAVAAGAGALPAEQSETVLQGSGSSMAPSVPVKRIVNRWARKLLLAGLVAGLALAMWWRLGSSWTNSLDMEFVWIPPGDFLMGTPRPEEGGYGDEAQHEVRIRRGFWLGKYEVTQREWEAVMGTNPSRFSDCGPRCPVDNVSWFDAKEFIQRLNERESGSGYEYRLPTEAEWEYAAKAGTSGIRYGELEEIAWCSNNSGGQTHPVGLKRPNAWGLYDMLGNVWEWTGDWYGEHSSGTETDPEAGPHRVFRGGGWLYRARYVRSAARSISSPGYRYHDIGFRLVRTFDTWR